MTKKRLIEDITQNPARYYRAPGDVPRDRRFSDPERIAILQAWRASDPSREEEIHTVLCGLERSRHAAE